MLLCPGLVRSGILCRFAAIPRSCRTRPRRRRRVTARENQLAPVPRMKYRGQVKRRPDPNQLIIDWNNPAPVSRGGDSTSPEKDGSGHSAPLSGDTSPLLIQRLPWDFKMTFPEPTEEALEAGILLDEDNHPENTKALHDEHAHQALAILHDLDAVLDARRRGVDPVTGKPAQTHTSRETLRRKLETEPGRLEQSFENLIAVYADAFGYEARDAFDKAIRAWHAGIEVKVCSVSPPLSQQTAPVRSNRLSSRMPVPRPLKSAVAAGRFGIENGKPINPSPDEVREITERHAEAMCGVNEAGWHAAVAKYAEDFGEKAAAQLERYVRAEIRRQDQGTAARVGRCRSHR